MYNINIGSLDMMNAITMSNVRANLAKTMESVCENHNPVIITSKNDKTVVMVYLEDYEAMKETAYLLKSPKNARRLLEAIDQANNGGGTTKDSGEWK